MKRGDHGALWKFGALLPRWIRVILAWLAAALSLPLVLALLHGAATRLGFSSCGLQLTPTEPWICSAAGRLFLFLAFLALALPPILIWARLLAKFSAPLELAQSRSSEGTADSNLSIETPKQLPLRQVYVAGVVRKPAGDSLQIFVGAERLTIAGSSPRLLRALRNQLYAEVVYQTIPCLPKVRFALAVRLARDDQVQTVATGVHAASVVMAAACLAWFGWLSPEPSTFWAILSALLLLTSTLYLSSVFKAVRSLKTICCSPEFSSAPRGREKGTDAG